MNIKNSMGLPYMSAIVTSVGINTAVVTDQYGKIHTVRTDIRRGKGPFPRVGEKWLIDRELGPWTFSACLTADLPKVTGSTDGLPALASLISALAQIGLIEDHTTSEQVRALHPHTHSDPQGGTTGADG